MTVHKVTTFITRTGQRYLGQIENELAPNERILNRDCQILSEPDE